MDLPFETPSDGDLRRRSSYLSMVRCKVNPKYDRDMFKSLGHAYSSSVCSRGRGKCHRGPTDPPMHATQFHSFTLRPCGHKTACRVGVDIRSFGFGRATIFIRAPSDLDIDLVRFGTCCLRMPRHARFMIPSRAGLFFKQLVSLMDYSEKTDLQ